MNDVEETYSSGRGPTHGGGAGEIFGAKMGFWSKQVIG